MGKIVSGLLVIFISFFLFQILEDYVASVSDFPLKKLIQLLIPGPQDSVLEFLQFVVYWVVGGSGVYLKFK